MDTETLQERVRQKLQDLGFVLVRFTAPPLGQAAEHFREWLAREYDGKMGYLRRRQEERLEPERLLSPLRSIIVLAYPYDTHLKNTQSAQEGNISRYAWGEDYHELLGEKLADFKDWFLREQPSGHCHGSVDAGPVLEKAWAEKAGLGWMGKHTNIINAQEGSYFFLATLLTDIEFVPDPAEVDRCGTCVRCIEVCPTGAIVAPYVLDARLCISYLTIELKGPIPRPLRSMIGNHVFGCDDCQEVCPWNRFSRLTTELRFLSQDTLRNQPLSTLLKITREEFKQRFKGSAIARPKWKGWMRNVLVAVGNSGCADWAPLVAAKLKESEPLVRGHAVWAYHQLLGAAARAELSAMKVGEKDDFVLEELEAALENLVSSV